MRNKILLTVAVIFVLIFNAHAQGKPGQWTPHMAFSQPFKTTASANRVYFATQGGIFYFNYADNSTNNLTRKEGLAETSIKEISFNHATQKLVIVYESGGIDLYSEDGSIFPILDLKRKNIPGLKTINNLYNDGKICYLSCGFGIVALDVERREIKDTYIIGPQGSYLAVNSTTTANGHIYAATPNGMMKAEMTKNLLDFSAWEKIVDTQLPDTEYWLTYSHNNTLYAITKAENENFGTLAFVKKENDVWRRAWWPFYAFREMKFINNDLVVVASDYEVNVYEPETGKRQVIKDYPFKIEGAASNPQSIHVDQNGAVWIADKNYGAIRFFNDKYEIIEPFGPKNNNIAGLSYSNGTLWAARGGITKAWSNAYEPPLLQYFNGQTWNYFDRTNTPELQQAFDIFRTVPVPGKSNHVFVSAYGHGLFEFEDSRLTKHYTNNNSSLMKIPLANSTSEIIRIGGMDFDQQGNLWVSNGLVVNNIHCRSTDGTWKSFHLPEIASEYNVGKLIVTSNNHIWMIVPRGQTRGLYVMSTDGSKKKHLDVRSYFTNSIDVRIEPMNDVYDIAEDLDGRIWVGTSRGIITYNNPSRVFDENPYYGYQPSVDLNDGIYHPLLETDLVTAIVVDGANQKWLGTEGSGLYLVSADGTIEIEHFTTENSPLLSNNITSLAYNGHQGVLYIGTTNGLVSYNTKSKSGNQAFADVYAYPNPVRPGYQGDIYISGLMYKTNVKITTVSGRLVYETTSEGGQAAWPGTDLAGNRVHSGVYLVFCANESGEQSEVTKILFIK